MTKKTSVEERRRVARLLDQKMCPRSIATAIGWKLEKVRWHIRQLVAKGAFTSIGRSGQYSRGKNARKWLSGIHPTPGQGGQSVPPNPCDEPPRHPGYILITGAQFTIPVIKSNGHRFQTYKINSTRVYSDRIRLRDCRAAFQLYNDKTILLTLGTIQLDAASIPDANSVISANVWQAVSMLSKRLDMILGIPDCKMDAKAVAAASAGDIPLIAGEIVTPIPGMENVKARISISPTLEINASPPGLSRETGSIDDAVTDANMIPRMRAVEKFQLQQAEVAEKILKALENLNTFLAGAGEIQPAGPGPEVR